MLLPSSSYLHHLLLNTVILIEYVTAHTCVTFVLYSVHCTLYTVQCTVYSVQCTVYSVQCTVYNYIVHYHLSRVSDHSTRQ